MAQDPSQLELFDENAVMDVLQKELAALKKRCDVLRRGMSSRYNKLAKLCIFLQEENALLKTRLEKIERGEREPILTEEPDFFCSVK